MADAGRAGVVGAAGHTAGPTAVESSGDMDFTDQELLTYVSALVNNQGLVAHNIDSFNSFLSPQGISKIVKQLFHVNQTHVDLRDQTDNDRDRTHISIELAFTDVEVTEPLYPTWSLGKILPLYPNGARLSGKTYSALLSLGARLVLTAYYKNGHSTTIETAVPPFQVSPIPVMLGSHPCHTSKMSDAAKKGIQEDPREQGGYFIAKNNEWAVEWLENIAFNKLHIYPNVVPAENCRGEFISQPGGAYENSSQVRIRSMKSGALTIELNSTEFKNVKFPFFVLYRVFGMTSDRDIAQTVVFDFDAVDPRAVSMLERLNLAFQYHDPVYEEVHSTVDREELVNWMAVFVSRLVTSRKFKSEDAAVQFLNEKLLDKLDRALLPHMGQDESTRIAKLRYLGDMIRQVYLVELKVQVPTDRDSFTNKRVHGAGTAVAKAFKTHFNSSVVGPAMKALRRMTKQTPFEDLKESNIRDAFRSAMSTNELNRALEQGITSGNKTITVRRHTVVNRVASTALERKNSLFYYSAMRSISAQGAAKASKQTERADRMRRTHPSFIGYVCVGQSADTGEKVGMSKQLAITASICQSSDTFPLKERLLADADLIPLAAVQPSSRILRENLASVSVNGEWIGCCRAPHEFVARYRAVRRASAGVDAQASIVWNQVADGVYFWLDAGRLTRPLIIVYNNLAAFVAEWRAAHAEKRSPAGPDATFRQWIRLTHGDIRALAAGRLTVEELRRRGVIEWITPEEAENCYLAPSVGTLSRLRDDYTAQFTHCDIEQAIFGLASLTSPHANHTQPARVTYQTNQARQACGWFSNAFPFRIDQNRFFQHYIQGPIVSTIVYQWLFPNGQNVDVAMMIDGGYNQEDSAIFSDAFVGRGGFAGTFYRTFRAELEKNEEFGTPDFTATRNLKPNASYAKLVNGFPKVGARIREGDIVIGRYAKPVGRARTGDADESLYTDRSIDYRLTEVATVVAVYQLRGPNDNLFGIVKLAYDRPIGVGDKISNREGNKSINSLHRAASDMPFDMDGLSPSLIINPHSLPSRMTVGQAIEGSEGLAASRHGAVVDGTSFRKVNVDAIARRLRGEGLRYNGLRTLFNGRTGQHYEVAIFVSPIFTQRLQKFVLDDEYSVGSSGTRDALTGQPLDGKSANGGLRIGEMEAWVLEAHGAAFTMTEKMFIDSDGMRSYICRNCGEFAVFNAARGIYRCKPCGPAANISTVDSCRASIAFRHEVRSANITIRLGLRPHEFERA